MPYLYTRFWRAAAADEPMVRPLLYDFPDDAAARDVEDSFMLGPDLLVAPVLEAGAVERAVTLPVHPGGWYDLDGTAYEGGMTVRVPTPLGRLPVFARAGALVPVSDADAGGERRVLLVFGTSPQSSTAELYEDDGETADWRTGGLAIRFERRGTALAMTSAGPFRPAFERIAVRALGGARIDLRPTTGPIALVAA
jgi:alpha-glucosidase